MDEMEHHQWQIFNEKYALVLNKAVFKWEKDNLDTEEQVKVKSKEVLEMKGISSISRVLFCKPIYSLVYKLCHFVVLTVWCLQYD